MGGSGFCHVVPFSSSFSARSSIFCTASSRSLFSCSFCSSSSFSFLCCSSHSSFNFLSCSSCRFLAASSFSFFILNSSCAFCSRSNHSSCNFCLSISNSFSSSSWWCSIKDSSSSSFCESPESLNRASSCRRFFRFSFFRAALYFLWLGFSGSTNVSGAAILPASPRLQEPAGRGGPKRERRRCAVSPEVGVHGSVPADQKRKIGGFCRWLTF